MKRRTFITITATAAAASTLRLNAQTPKFYPLNEPPLENVTPNSGDDTAAKLELGETETLEQLERRLNIKARREREAICLIDILVETARASLAGGVIGAVLGLMA
jgi:hypothetical protein